MKKYEIIFRDFKNGILNGKYKAGDKLPTEAELSAQYGVSRVPVQQAMNALTSAGYTSRRAGVGTIVTFDSHLQGKSDCKTVFLLSELNMETAQITEGIQSVLHERGIFVTTRFSYSNPAVERRVLQQLRDGEIEGLIMYESSSDENIDLIYELIVNHAPLILVDNLPNKIICNCVMSDPVQAMHSMVEHLYSNGHRRIAVMTHQLAKRSAATIRLNMLQVSMESYGLTLPEEYIKSDQDPAREMRELMALPQPPTAIVFTAAVLATGCVGIFNQLNLKIPRDISVLVHDDIERFSSQYNMRLTSVAQNYFEIGSVAADRLYKYLIQPDKKFCVEYIPTIFHEGESVSKIQ